MTAKKTQEGKLVPTSPAGVANLSFDSDIADYKSVLKLTSDKKVEIQSIKDEINTFLKNHNSSYGVSSLDSALSNLCVNKENPEPDVPKWVGELREIRPYFVEELYSLFTGYSQSAELFKKQVGEKGSKAIGELVDAEEKRRSFQKYARDENATEKAKKQLEALRDKLVKAESNLELLLERKNNAKEFVGYVKDLASIASVGKK